MRRGDQRLTITQAAKRCGVHRSVLSRQLSAAGVALGKDRRVSWLKVLDVREGAVDRDKRNPGYGMNGSGGSADDECSPGELREARRRLYELQAREREGQLLPLEDVIAERRMVAEVLNNDLMSLGVRLSTRLAKRMSPSRVRKIIDAEIVEMMTRWKQGKTID